MNLKEIFPYILRSSHFHEGKSFHKLCIEKLRTTKKDPKYTRDMKGRAVICKEETQNVYLVEGKLKDETERRMEQTHL